MASLYSLYYLGSYLKNLQKKLNEEIKSLNKESRLNIDEEKERLFHEYKLGPLTLDKAKPSEAKRRRSSKINMWGDEVEVDVYDMKITIPFKGNQNLFQCKPSSSVLTHLDNHTLDVKSNKITITITLDDLSESSYRKELGEVLSYIQPNIPFINREIKPWDDGLRTLIDNEFKKFEDHITKERAFYKSIGLTTNEKADKFITPSPVTRKHIPQPKLDNSNTITVVPPKLKDEIYKDIISTLSNVGKAIEKKPSLYKDKGEEDLRDVFLLFLETRYESTTATGETFNKGGKTDILLKYATDGSNLFVAECKIWKGEQKFLEAINQTAGYLTWRDSKAAIMLFVDNKSLTKIIETVKSTIKTHPLFKKVIIESSESLSYIIGSEDDKDIDLYLEIMFFHFPDRK